MKSLKESGRARGPRSLVALGLAVMLILTSTAQAAGRGKGAIVSVVTTTGPGQAYSGELIGVRSDAIILGTATEETRTIAVSEILIVRVHRRSKLAAGGAIGMLAGGTVSFIASYSRYKDELLGVFGIIGYTMIGAAGGLLVGGIAGAAAGTDKTYQLSGLSESARRVIMDKLRKKARIPSYR